MATQRKETIDPAAIRTKITTICPDFVLGQYQDAHEFFFGLLQAMTTAYLQRFPESAQFDQATCETTPIQQIFGGRMNSIKFCPLCQHSSPVESEYLQDIAVDLEQTSTLVDALDRHFASKPSAVKVCEKCKQTVTMTEKLSLQRTPNVLCIQLKRFRINTLTQKTVKMTKLITIPQKLNVSKYSSDNEESMQYRLVATITHVSYSNDANSGHYTAIGSTAAPNKYYAFDDAEVDEIHLGDEIESNAYVLFYERDTMRERPFAPSSPIVDSSSRNDVGNLDAGWNNADDQSPALR